MQIDITGHQMDITDALRQHVTKAVAKLEDLTDAAIGNIHVVLEVNKQRQHCSMTVNISGDCFTAKDDSDNMYSAIDHAVGKIRRQMETSKSRHKEARHH